MKNKDYLKVNGENADTICSKIRGEADAEALDILERARTEKDRISREAKKAAEEERDHILKEAEKEVEKLKDRIFSTLNLEKKRIILEEKSRFIEDVVRVVKKRAEGFRAAAEYPDFLKRSVIEGVEIVDVGAITVFYSLLDHGLMNDSFINGVEKNVKAQSNKNIALTFKESDFKDIGVIIQSEDGRLVYDNRFLTRLKRLYDEVYMALLKEAW